MAAQGEEGWVQALTAIFHRGKGQPSPSASATGSAASSAPVLGSSSSSLVASVGAKAKGKGKVPPAPPRATRPSASASNAPPRATRPSAPASHAPTGGKAKGKGQGEAPPAPPPRQDVERRRATRQQLEAQAAREVVPHHLRAPEGAAQLRCLKTTSDIDGTLWEGMDPWSLEPSLTCHINLERLQEQWLPPPAAPALAVGLTARAADGVLPTSISQSVQIAMHGLRLTPDLVRRALTQDLDILTVEQTLGLEREILPPLRQEVGIISDLHAAVARSGQASLRPAEALLWIVGTLPHGLQRVRLASLRHTLPEEVTSAKAHVATATTLVKQIQHSQHLKAILHSMLVIHNVLAQQECNAFPLSSLVTADRERLRRPVGGLHADRENNWFNQNFPSTMRLAAEVIADAHALERRLRFHRMVAVGGLFKASHVKQLIWDYLDDMEEGIVSVFPLLARCTRVVFDRDLIYHFEHMARMLGTFQTDVQAVQVAIDQSSASTVLPEQIAELSVCMTEARSAFLAEQAQLSDVAQRLCDLVGEQVGMSRDRYHRQMSLTHQRCTAATEAFHCLRHFGAIMHKELKMVWSLRAREQQQQRAAMAGDLDGVRRAARCWAPIDTSEQELLHTHDPDTIRRVRASKRAPFDVTAEVAPGQEAAIQPEKFALPASSSTIHGGIEGSYARDPLTGRWGRTTAMAEGTMVGATARNMLYEVDPDKVRAFRNPTQAPSDVVVEPMSWRRLSGQNAVDAVTRSVNVDAQACESLAHGGAVGHYCRDPVTGLWGTRRYA